MMRTINQRVFCLLIFSQLFVAAAFADNADLVCYERNKSINGEPVAQMATLKETLTAASKSVVSSSTYPLVGKYKEISYGEGQKQTVFQLQNPDYNALIMECGKRIKPHDQILGIGAFNAKSKSLENGIIPIVDNLKVMDFLKKNKLLAMLKTMDLLSGLVDTEKNFKQFFADYQRDLSDAQIQFTKGRAVRLSDLIANSVAKEENINLFYFNLMHSIQLMEPGLTEEEASAISEFIIRYNNQSGFVSLATILIGNTLHVDSILNPKDRSFSYLFTPSKDHKHIHVEIVSSSTLPGYVLSDQHKEPVLGDYKYRFSIPLVIDLSSYKLPDPSNPSLEKNAPMLTIAVIPSLFDSFQVEAPSDLLFSNYVKQSWLDLKKSPSFNQDSWSIIDDGKK